MKHHLFHRLALAAVGLCAALTGSAATLVAEVSFNGSATSPGNLITLNPVGGDSGYEFVSVGGSACIHATDFIYFQVNKSAVASTDNNLIIEVEYYDVPGNFSLHYNATNTVNYKQSNFNMGGSSLWNKATIALTDASLRGAQNGGADFRVASGVYLRSLKIYKGTLDYNAETAPTYTAAPEYAQFEGKSVAGYQMWFSTGDATSGWIHWHGTSWPSHENLSFEIYPDVSEYPDDALAQTGFAPLGNGQPSRLYDASHADVIDTHFKWMQAAHIDGVAVQRFINGLGKVVIESEGDKLVKVKRQAEQNSRLFYVCYDISSTGLESEWVDRIKFDWVYNVEQALDLSRSDAYAKVGNRPVVEVWGIGFTGNHPGTAAETLELIRWLQARGCYVIGGVPTWWRTGTGDSKADFYDVYLSLDMISPWFVGRFSDNAGADQFLNNPMKGDAQLCQSRGVAYMPTLCPGFAWSQWNGAATGTSGDVNACPRNAGDFLWHQASNIMDLYAYGVKNMYFAMFDEYDEGTALIKAATDYSMLPTDQYFLTTSADGYWLSSDYSLRVAGAAIDMQKSGVKLTDIPVPHSEGPVYYRNSFESRTTRYNYYEGAYHNTGTFPLDPCFKNPAERYATNVNNRSTAIILGADAQSAAPTGLYLADFKGTASAPGSYVYKIADCRISVAADAELSYAFYPLNEGGRHAAVSLLFSDGTMLHDLDLTDKQGVSVNPATPRGTVGTWTTHTVRIGKGDLVGKTITAVLFCYEDNAAEAFEAYFDDLLIEIGDGTDYEAPLSQLPDLVIDEITWSPASPKVGDAVTFSAVIRNQGDAATPDDTKVGVAFHINAIGTSSTWNDQYRGPLAAGATITLTATGGAAESPSWTPAESGDYEVIAWVNDNGGTFEESDMTNNQLTATLTIGEQNGILDVLADPSAIAVVYDALGRKVYEGSLDAFPGHGVFVVRSGARTFKIVR